MHMSIWKIYGKKGEEAMQARTVSKGCVGRSIMPNTRPINRTLTELLRYKVDLNKRLQRTSDLTSEDRRARKEILQIINELGYVIKMGVKEE